MANFLGKTLVGLVAACVAHGVTLAQDVQQNFQEAIRLVRMNKEEEGLAKLREVIEADPTQEVAFATWQATDVFEWQMLLEEGGEFERIARELMQRATAGRKAMSRDDDKIAELIEQTRAEDYATRSAAMGELAANHAEFAVPQLLRVLADTDADEEQDLAMLTLFRIGRPAVLPLIQALKSDNDLLRRNAAAALLEIGDSRAAASLVQLANDTSSGVREIATRAIERFGLESGADPVAMHVDAARAYLAGTGVGAGEHSEVVWTWDDSVNNVVAHDVPAALYSFELAKIHAQDAMRLDPANEGAQGLLAAAYIAQAKTIEDQGLEAGGVQRLRMVAAALGEDAIEHGIREAAMSKDMVDALIMELGRFEGGDEIRGESLVEALGHDDAGIRYAAALALSQRAEGDALPAAEQVVRVLADAVTEEAQRAVLVIDGNPLTQKAVTEASAERGVTIRAATTDKSGLSQFFAFPHFDVVVVSDQLEDPVTVINLIRQRTPTTKIVLLSKAEDAETTFEGKVDAVLAPEADLTSGELLTQVEEIVEEFDPRRERADHVAVAASQALAGLADSGVSIRGSLDALAAQLDRDPNVAIPAAEALGGGATLAQAASLVAALSRDEANVEELGALKIAAAEALGRILERADSVPAEVQNALIAVAANDAADIDLRQAAALALGKGKLDAGARLKLAELLRAIPSIDG